MPKRIFWLALGALSLAGCASFGQNKNVKNEWDCAAQEGFGCRSIETIRSLIARPGEGPAPVVVGSTPNLEGQGAPMWRPDQIMKISIADFVDQDGNYHAESVIFTVVQKGGWAIESGSEDSN